MTEHRAWIVRSDRDLRKAWARDSWSWSPENSSSILPVAILSSSSRNLASQSERASSIGVLGECFDRSARSRRLDADRSDDPIFQPDRRAEDEAKTSEVISDAHGDLNRGPVRIASSHAKAVEPVAAGTCLRLLAFSGFLEMRFRSALCVSMLQWEQIGRGTEARTKRRETERMFRGKWSSLRRFYMATVSLLGLPCITLRASRRWFSAQCACIWWRDRARNVWWTEWKRVHPCLRNNVVRNTVPNRDGGEIIDSRGVLWLERAFDVTDESSVSLRWLDRAGVKHSENLGGIHKSLQEIIVVRELREMCEIKTTDLKNNSQRGETQFSL